MPFSPLFGLPSEKLVQVKHHPGCGDAKMSRGKFHGELSNKSSSDPLIIRFEIPIFFWGKLFQGQNKRQKEDETFRWAENLNKKSILFAFFWGAAVRIFQALPWNHCQVLVGFSRSFHPSTILWKKLLQKNAPELLEASTTWMSRDGT